MGNSQLSLNLLLLKKWKKIHFKTITLVGVGILSFSSPIWSALIPLPASGHHSHAVWFKVKNNSNVPLHYAYDDEHHVGDSGRIEEFDLQSISKKSAILIYNKVHLVKKGEL
ncbi:hypothetical protein BH10PSE19_BH10PSE19_12310 [soil metagenome]